MGNKEIWILRFIASSEQPVNKYQIEHAKTADIGRPPPHATVFNTVNRMKKEQLIRITSPVRLSRVGLPVESYDVTFLGLVWALCRTQPKGPRLDISRLTSKYRQFLPLILNKWDYFKQERLSDEAFTALSTAAYRYVHHFDPAEIEAALKMPGSPALATHSKVSLLEAYFLLYLEPYSRLGGGPEQAWIPEPKRKRLLAAIGKDTDLADGCRRTLRAVTDYHQDTIHDWTKRIENGLTGSS